MGSGGSSVSKGVIAAVKASSAEELTAVLWEFDAASKQRLISTLQVSPVKHKVLLIGGTGFIGRNVAKRLLADGHSVVGLARREEAKSALVAIGVEPCYVADGLHGDAAELAAAAKGCSACIEAAALNKRMAIPGIKAIRSALGADGIFISTTGQNHYGDVPSSLTVPVPEDREFGWKPRVPELWSEGARQNIEKLAMWWTRYEAAVLDAPDNPETGAVRTCIIRPAFVYGNGDGGLGEGMIGQLKHWLKQGRVQCIDDGRTLGEPRRSTVHIDDLADLYVIALRSLSSGRLPAGSALNAASGTYSLRGLADAMATACGGLPVQEIPLADAAETFGIFTAEENGLICIADSSKARQLGWAPTGPSVIEDVAKGSYVDVGQKLRSSLAPQM